MLNIRLRWGAAAIGISTRGGAPQHAALSFAYFSSPMKTIIIWPMRLFGPATTPMVNAMNGVKKTTKMAVAMS
jgi:hypothetical protein